MKTLNKLSGCMLMLSFTATIFLAASLPAQILITAAGGFVGDGGQATNASLIFPEGIAIDIAGNLYIGGFSQQRVRKVTPSGVITTVAGHSAKFSRDPSLFYNTGWRSWSHKAIICTINTRLATAAIT